VLAASIATLHSGLPVSNCLMCHAGETYAGVPAPYIPMSMSGVSPYKKTPLSPPHIPVLVGVDCSACHGAAYQSGGFGPATAMSSAKHAFVSTSCDTCHDTGKSFLRRRRHTAPAEACGPRDEHRSAHGDQRLLGLPRNQGLGEHCDAAGHMPNPSNLTCAQCHASAPSNYTPATLAANSVLHTGLTGNCGLCHGNPTTALTFFNNFTPKDAVLSPAHIPYLASADCSACHSSATYAPGTFGPISMSAAKHAFVPTACDTCHEAGLSFYLGASTPPLQGRPADHISSSNSQMVSGDCSGCHETTDWNSNTLPAGICQTPVIRRARSATRPSAARWRATRR